MYGLQILTVVELILRSALKRLVMAMLNAVTWRHAKIASAGFWEYRIIIFSKTLKVVKP